jgi:hypothetical protein
MGNTSAMIDRSDNKDRIETPMDEMKDPEKGFSGYLSGFDLATLIQTCALNGITGSLQITYEGEKGQVFFKQGEIIHALCGGLNGLQAFHRIFAWQGGDIHLEPDVLPARETIELHWNALVIDAMARIEEQAADQSADEITPEARTTAAVETFQLNKLYSDALNWGEVRNCVIYALETEKVLRPSSSIMAVKEWAQVFGELFFHTKDLWASEGTPSPRMLSVTLNQGTWILVPHGSYLIALEITRGVDVGGLHRKVLRALTEYS